MVNALIEPAATGSTRSLTGRRTTFPARLLALFGVLVSMQLPAQDIPTLDEAIAMRDVQVVGLGSSVRQIGYREYEATLVREHGDTRPDTEVRLTAAGVVELSGGAQTVASFHGRESVVLTPERSSVAWRFTIDRSGWYNIGLEYYPMEGRGVPAERDLSIDGERPFDEARSIVLQRIWRDADANRRDSMGNDLRPRQVEAPEWTHQTFRDLEGYFVEPYLFYLSAGTHVLRLNGRREPIAIETVRIYQEPAIPSYREQLTAWKSQGVSPVSNGQIKIQAEAAYRKSDPSLYPIYDRSTPATEPSHFYKIRLNTIGGVNWRFTGQWIEWQIDAPSTGLYELGFRVRQDQVRGIFSNRTLFVNGEVPFAEAEELRFNFDRGWQRYRFGTDDEPYLIKLNEGTNTIRLEVTLGPISRIIRAVEESVFELNSLYRTIVMITGPVPDPFRDYNLESQIANLVRTLETETKVLTAVVRELQAVTGDTGGSMAVLQRLIRQMGDMSARPNTIPDRLDTFLVNIGALSTWLYDVRQLPLELDYIVVQGTNDELPRSNIGFFRNAAYSIGGFAASFFVDYNTIGVAADAEDPIEVWLVGGRQQAQIIKELIDDSFSPDTGVGVEMKIVDQQIVLPSILSGTGPDVVLNQRRAQPVDYALRNGVQDLTDFPDFPEVAARFHESAITPFRWNGGVYALPETQLFDVMFYRDDVLQELGIDLPQTWDDLYRVIPELQKRNLDFGLPFQQYSGADLNVQPINSAFAMLLFQSGGRFYREDGSASALDENESIEAFRNWTELYTSFKLPLEYALQQRFRTGEMPIAIGYFNFYNVLTVFAPEIRGLWNFAPVPGTRRPDGSITRKVATEVTASIMLEASEHKDASWDFLKWWTSTPTQIEYGREMETVLGPAARNPTANMEALASLGWPIDVVESLQAQWDDVEGIPETPGGYFTGRHIENAFREVVYQGGDPRETLLDYVDTINEEIRIKREEFGIE